MPVKNVECQIAEMQIGRHVSGEALSEVALSQLEAHLSKCLSCSRVLANRRQALRSMLQQGYAAVTTDVPAQRKEHLLIQALRDKVETAPKKAPRPAVEADPQPTSYKPWSIDSLTKLTREAQNPPEERVSNGHAAHPATSLTKSYGKPLLYSATLAVVLFLMGYLSHGQNSLLGNTAASAYPDQAPAAANSHPSKPNNTSSPQAPAKSETPIPVKTKEPQIRAHSNNSSDGKNSFVAGGPALKNAGGPPDSLRSSSFGGASAHSKPSAPVRNQVPTFSLPIHHRTAKRNERARIHSAPVRILKPTNRITIYDESGNPLAG